MPRQKKTREFSTEAKIGKILILVGIITQAIGIAAVLAISSGMMGYWGMMSWGGMMGSVFGGMFYALGLVQIIGLIVGIYAYKSAEKGDFHNAGILAVVASVIPPLQLISLVGGILCLASREAKK
ncbi:hypothetical protein D4Q76_01905 [archaeon]|nr:MAG: hypothetical protein D4Q76_01905 [archaeon]